MHPASSAGILCVSCCGFHRSKSLSANHVAAGHSGEGLSRNTRRRSEHTAAADVDLCSDVTGDVRGDAAGEHL